jgi:hypothetical protein
MDFIWILVGMPIVCGLYSIYLLLRDRLQENGRRRRVRALAALALPPGASNAKYSSGVLVGGLQKGKAKTG